MVSQSLTNEEHELSEPVNQYHNIPTQHGTMTISLQNHSELIVWEADHSDIVTTKFRLDSCSNIVGCVKTDKDIVILYHDINGYTKLASVNVDIAQIVNISAISDIPDINKLVNPITSVSNLVYTSMMPMGDTVIISALDPSSGYGVIINITIRPKLNMDHSILFGSRTPSSIDDIVDIVLQPNVTDQGNVKVSLISSERVADMFYDPILKNVQPRDTVLGNYVPV